jgi:ADP-ribosylglycohydrolase
MLGAIIGDIVGSRWEFNPTNDYNFEWQSDMNGFTDDTICTVAVADALLKGRDFGESIHDWCNRYPHPMGSYGGRFAQWVRSDKPQPYNSFGNGSAMRVSPVAYCYEDEYQMLNAAEATAACSHNHPEGIKGAKTVAMAIHTAMELHLGCEVLGEKEIDYILSRCTAISDYDIEIKKADVINRFDETCQGTVPVALWIIGESNSFEDAIRKAVSLGADADTLGAIVGSIAEAIWGIPIELQLQAMKYLPTDMKKVVLQFYRRYIRDSLIAGYGDEGAALDIVPED